MTLTTEMTALIKELADEELNNIDQNEDVDRTSLLVDIMIWAEQPVLTGEEVANIADIVELEIENEEEEYDHIVDKEYVKRLNNILKWVRGQR